MHNLMFTVSSKHTCVCFLLCYLACFIVSSLGQYIAHTSCFLYRSTCIDTYMGYVDLHCSVNEAANFGKSLVPVNERICNELSVVTMPSVDCSLGLVHMLIT